MRKALYRKLVQRYTERKLSSDELEVFSYLLDKGKVDDVILDAMDEDILMLAGESVKQIPKFPFNKIFKYAAVACILITVGTVFFVRQTKVVPGATVQMKHQASGTDKAVLILADGKKISLNDAADGVLARQAGMNIVKSAEGHLIYSVEGNKQAGTMGTIYNTIQTPRAGNYQIRLSDGTIVWLNAVSSLKFPASFEGLGTREVEIKGEVYFEVSHNKEQPFIVKSDGQEVKVLGTRFNINAYHDEPSSTTTLIEGSVAISSKGANPVRLMPGQQAELKNGRIKVRSIDAGAAIAWMNGDFNFKDEDIRSIMRKLKRWYNIEVIYEGKVNEMSFWAEISRNRSLSQVLNILEETGNVHFKVEGRRVTVMP